MSQIDTMVETVIGAVQVFVAKRISELTGTFGARFQDLEQRVAVRPERGEPGAKGDPGSNGQDGRDGKDGAPGPQGVSGKDGAAGKDGERGADGPQGVAGTDGKDGSNGVDGKDGAAGPQGVAGERGDVGPQGIAGKDGSDGINGKDGAIGPQGPAGKDGAEGLHGKDGAPGERGLDGARGELGPQGPAGINGKDGMPGPQGEPGIHGKDGAPGISAFEIAKKSGFVGSEGEWLLFLRGEDGTPGKDGDDGADGQDGRDGRDGDPGAPGRDALEIDVLDGVDHARSYPRGTFASFNGGTWRAARATDPLTEKAPRDAGWACVMAGLASIATELEDGGRFLSLEFTLADGIVIKQRHQTAMQINRHVWQMGKAYLPGDITTYDGSQWLARQKTIARPKGSDDWLLVVKAGKPGKDFRPSEEE